MTAVKERAVNIIQLMPEQEVMQFVIKNEHYEKPGTQTAKSGKRKLGIGDGKYKIPDDINAYDDEIAEMFGV